MSSKGLKPLVLTRLSRAIPSRWATILKDDALIIFSVFLSEPPLKCHLVKDSEPKPPVIYPASREYFLLLPAIVRSPMPVPRWGRKEA